ncbi:hypothetical protein [Streptomyces xiaopingdaonensis]|uniref:hypothetical protein n=1 Tax=Streptomyces xiaopingdaonensis TaxID=1565415 RepID=UPI0002F16BED|nr:hypothetical protein [Streptomyces xiaopingdaonensis]
MEKAWWVALGVVVALALVTAVVDGRGRLGARRRPQQPGAPAPGEVWWAVDEPPPEPHTPPGMRLCLVLGVHGGRARVARVTTSESAPGADELPLPPESVSARETDARTPRVRAGGPGEDVELKDLRYRAGRVDAALWRRVRDGQG